MLDFSPFLDLPLLASCIMALAVFLYVLLDGFDLGVGILFPFAPSKDCRDKMMNSIAPFWDGNETWLVLGGGLLFSAFPLAYAILLPAFYIPLILMLLGLIFRGVAFEFRFKEQGKMHILWDYSFHLGSVCATFFQGILLGAFVSGVTTQGRAFGGGSFDWLNGFSVLTGIALVFGYSLLGATWLLMKTDHKTQEWARKIAFRSLFYVVFFLGIVSLWVPFLNETIFTRWFSLPNFFYFLPIPLLTGLSFLGLYKSLLKKQEIQPFFIVLAIFSLGYLGLGISLWPWIVPYHISIWDAAAGAKSLSLLLMAVVILLPVILGYTAYAYYVFRGKSRASYED
jgi:cytochrome d ubiquinol oxidase subunit II